MRVALVQGTGPWHDWRAGGIGGSEACSVMNCSPYTTKHNLALYKTGAKEPPEFPEFLAKKGHAKEIIGRNYAEAMLGVTLYAECYQSDDFDFIRASLDGINSDKTITFESKFVGAKAFKAQQKSLEIPDHHYWQIVQGFIAVKKATHCYYVVVNDSDECHGVMVERIESDCKTLQTALCEFWAYIKSGVDIVDESPEFVDLSGNNEFNAAMADYLRACKSIKKQESERDAAKKILLNLANHQSSQCDAGKVKFYDVKGAVDYVKLLSVYKIDAEAYRQKTTVRSRITAHEK
jgi:putative phage-type endonuclease